MEWLTYDRCCGFNIIEANNEEEAEEVSNSVILDKLSEIDKQIVTRIKKLLE